MWPSTRPTVVPHSAASSATVIFARPLAGIAPSRKRHGSSATGLGPALTMAEGVRFQAVPQPRSGAIGPKVFGLHPLAKLVFVGVGVRHGADSSKGSSPP